MSNFPIISTAGPLLLLVASRLLLMIHHAHAQWNDVQCCAGLSYGAVRCCLGQLFTVATVAIS
jgi:hypothetical protein